nr:type II secretion system F family protein [Nocardioides sp. zg-DK7169]
MSPAHRVAVYTARASRAPHAAETRVDADEALRQARGAAERVLQRHGSLETRIARRLEAAGSELRAAEWLLVHIAVFVSAGLLGLLVGQGGLLLGVVFLTLGAVGPWAYLGRRRARRRRAFDRALPGTLSLLAGALSAGQSLPQSIDTVAREGAEPIASELRRVLVELRLGVSMEDALDSVATRFESKDFAWVVMAIRIQREVGGNLAELLGTVAATMREREQLRQQVNALAAEGKLSAWVLSLLPPVFLVYLLVANRDYVAPLLGDPRGWVLMLGGGLWLAVGIFWMSRLIKVEV